jgi:hypothetical protein
MATGAFVDMRPMLGAFSRGGFVSAVTVVPL